MDGKTWLLELTGERFGPWAWFMLFAAMVIGPLAAWISRYKRKREDR